MRSVDIGIYFDQGVVNPLQTLGLAMGAGFSSGLNLYATVATA